MTYIFNGALGAVGADGVTVVEASALVPMAFVARTRIVCATPPVRPVNEVLRYPEVRRFVPK